MILIASTASIRTRSAACAAAHAVFECRVVMARRINESLDKELRALEMAYYRRAVELSKKPKKSALKVT